MEKVGADLHNRLNRELKIIFNRMKNDQSYSPLPDNISFGELFTNKMHVIALIRKGVPYSLFSLIRDFAPFEENEWADLLNVSSRSLQRYKISKQKFKPAQSEKILEMAEVANTGLDTFGDMERFRLWLNTPSYALGTKKPKELLRDSYGKEMVVGELTRINHGILS